MASLEAGRNLGCGSRASGRMVYNSLVGSHRRNRLLRSIRLSTLDSSTRTIHLRRSSNVKDQPSKTTPQPCLLSAATVLPAQDVLTVRDNQDGISQLLYP